MSNHSLDKCRILVVEDEYFLADELAVELTNAGAMVVGPMANVTSALTFLDDDIPLDGAILDVNLGGDTAYAIADVLISRGVPLVFTTGYDRAAIPERFAGIVSCEKPITFRRIAEAISTAIHH